MLTQLMTWWNGSSSEKCRGTQSDESFQKTECKKSDSANGLITLTRKDNTMKTFAVKVRKGERGAGKTLAILKATEEDVNKVAEEMQEGEEGNVFVAEYTPPAILTLDEFRQQQKAEADKAKTAADALAKLSDAERAALGL